MNALCNIFIYYAGITVYVKTFEAEKLFVDFSEMRKFDYWIFSSPLQIP